MKFSRKSLLIGTMVFVFGCTSIIFVVLYDRRNDACSASKDRTKKRYSTGPEVSTTQQHFYPASPTMSEPNVREGEVAEKKVPTTPPVEYPELDLSDLFEKHVLPSPQNPLWTGKVDAILSRIYQKYKFSPKPRSLFREQDESEEVRQWLQPIRENYSRIKNISLRFSVKANVENYSYSGDIKSIVQPSEWMSLELTTSMGGRTVAASDGTFMFRGEGRADETIGLRVSLDSNLPADPMLFDILGRSYRLPEDKLPTDSANTVCFQSDKYTIWVDRNKKLISRIKTQSENGITRELIIRKYETFSDDIVYPVQITTIETLHDEKIVCEQLHSDIIINAESLDLEKFHELPNTYFLLAEELE